MSERRLTYRNDYARGRESALAGQPIIEPDDVSDYYGQPCARWGQCVIPADEERDPVPTVYAHAHGGGQVELEGFRLSLDVAEQFAARVLNAVRYQRAQLSPSTRDGVTR